ncbi:purine permease [Artemisia annua]|uniref:Purine permease n=1 Tax=Artemisia annua TaxID=35608 RepID=A0A2U1LKD3_ARTAN|nr:purine permease [Artemisia annua]
MPARDNMLYFVGLLYLSASTYSLICATQLAFNAVFSFFINSQKLTALIFNSVVVLSLSASLLAVNDDSDKPSGVTNGKYSLSFVATLGASGLYALLLSTIYATYISKVVSWKTLGDEMGSFGKGGLTYVMTVWTAVSWQVCFVGVVGLVFVVSSLFSNVISPLSLALTPLAAVAVFHDKGVKIFAMLLGFWGFCTYIYQNYLDDAEDKRKQTDANDMQP